LEHLGRSSGWVFKHTFSCACDGAKQTWLPENFPQAPLICVNICELHAGWALNIVVGDESNVPDVDLFVAGFVRKSVSTDKTLAPKYGLRIDERAGKTGETFRGVGGLHEALPPEAGHLGERGRPAQETAVAHADPVCAHGF